MGDRVFQKTETPEMRGLDNWGWAQRDEKRREHFSQKVRNVRKCPAQNVLRKKSLHCSKSQQELEYLNTHASGVITEYLWSCPSPRRPWPRASPEHQRTWNSLTRPPKPQDPGTAPGLKGAPAHSPTKGNTRGGPGQGPPTGTTRPNQPAAHPGMFGYNGPYFLDSQKRNTPRTFDLCNGCEKVLQEILQDYKIIWQRHQDNQQEFRSLLRSNCHGFERAFVTKENYPVGSNLSYDWQRKTIQVKPDLYSTFIKEHPFSEKTWEECAVVGNGGILSNSSCGDMIDSAQFVIRCNLPPLRDGYEKHVGSKTNLVTANPTILRQQYGSLMNRRGSFMERLGPYGSSLLLLPAFSFGYDTLTCQRAAYAVEDLGSPIRPVFFNPEYIRNLTHFWRTQGLGGRRLSSGIVMVSLALEVCENVHLYGFWPFGFHPFELHNLTHHYYDDVAAKKGVHAMPAEFKLLLQLHNQGVLNLHLRACRPGMK